jgi:hypothetical protein
MMTVVPQIATVAVTRAVVAATMTVWRMCFLLFWRRRHVQGLGVQNDRGLQVSVPVENRSDKKPALYLR